MSVPRATVQQTLRQGAVYYLPQWWLKNGLPHFFIVMNEDPKLDTITLAYVVTSQVEKVEERIRLRCRPEETLVHIHKGTSIARFDKRFVFDKPSIVDCNSCIDFSRSEFEAAMKQSVSTYTGQFGVDMLERLKKGANMSPVLTDATKSAMGALNLRPPVKAASRFKTTIRVSPLPNGKA
jgi:hypothetical protein